MVWCVVFVFNLHRYYVFKGCLDINLLPSDYISYRLNVRFNIICKSKLEHKVFILFFFFARPTDRPTITRDRAMGNETFYWHGLSLYTLLISLRAIFNFQWMTSFAKISYTWPKWLPKMKALLTLILQCVHIKRNVFTLYQEEYFLYTMSLWVCYRNFKAFVQRYSWIDDIEGKLELIYMQKKSAN